MASSPLSSCASYVCLRTSRVHEQSPQCATVETPYQVRTSYSAAHVAAQEATEALLPRRAAHCPPWSSGIGAARTHRAKAEAALLDASASSRCLPLEPCIMKHTGSVCETMSLQGRGG